MGDVRVEIPDRIVLAANFTIEPIGSPLMSLLGKVSIDAQIEFAPYNQVVQQLLDPNSLFSRNQKGVNVVFLRLEDLIDSRTADLDFLKGQIDTVRSNASDLAKRLAAAERFGVPLFVFLCPPSARIVAEPKLFSDLKSIEQSLKDDVSGIANLYIFGTDHLTSRYLVETADNPKGNILGHIPYTAEFISALAAETVRKIDTFRRKPFKVLVLDCDNTLWDGIVGEDGVSGIGFSERRLFLQEFAVTQSESGMVVCLNSKNNEPDVWEAFDKRDDMVLKREHIVASRINWLPKSQNLRSLAEELQLGLDSFVFVDDDPAVCSEVRRNCPEVLTVLLPQETDYSRYFDHLWAFDRLKITNEDRERTKSYQNQALRRELQEKAGDMTEFLKSLELVCEISELAVADIPRVSQLTLRTNQFNSTTIRYTEADIRRLNSEDGKNVWTVRVRDRFGDYGLVGVVIFQEREESIFVESLILSCRVLGRGVEHEIVRELGKKAKASDREFVSVNFVQTAKNAPILNFLVDVAGDPWMVEDGVTTYRLTADAALECAPGLKPAVGNGSGQADAEKPVGPAPQLSDPNRFQAYLEIADSLSIKGALPPDDDATELSRDDMRSEFRAARTDTEKILTQIWEKVLNIKNIGVADNFFEIGGDSMLAVTLFVEIEEKFGRWLPLYHLIDSPTIEKLALRIEAEADSSGLKYLVPIRAEGNLPPLFCFHAAGGNILNYLELANALGEDQPVYGLQMRGVADKSETAHKRVEEMAEEYLRELRGFQPHGPYRLCGASFGGLVAYEAARQLREAGESVSILALIDTYAPGYLTNNSTTTGPGKRLSKLVGKVRFNLFYLSQLPTKREAIDHITGRLRAVVLRLRRKAYWKKNAIAIQYNKATGKELPKDMLRNVKAIKEAENSYRPLPYDGRIILFRALFRPNHIKFDPFLGWKEFAGGEIVIEDVRGNHNTVMAYPFVDEFAQIFRRHLTEVESAKAIAASAGK